MEYTVKAFKIIYLNGVTTLEDYERKVPNYTEGIKEQNRLKCLGQYCNITVERIKKLSRVL